jgi:tight adherence protein B
VTAVLAATLALLVASQAGGATKQRYGLRQVEFSDYPVVGLVVRGAKGEKPPAIYENGQKVQGLEVQSLGRSKAVLLAIDRSKSMHGAPLNRAVAAARQYLNSKPPSDHVGVVSFASSAIVQARLEQSTIDADIALRSMSTDVKEGTALADAVVVAAGELGSQGLSGRVLILLTDGRNVRSLASWAEAVKAARRAHIVVYPIALGDADRAPLAQLARATGGLVYTSPTPADLSQVYSRIGADLNSTWRMSYTTAARPGDRIRVALGSARGPSRIALVPGTSVVPGRSWLPSSLQGTLGVLLLLLIVGTLVYLAVERFQALPRAAKIKRLVRSHTEARGTATRRQRRRPTVQTMFGAVDRRLRGLRRFERIERLVETAAIPASASTFLVGAVGLAILLPLLGAALGIGSPVVYLLLFVGGLAVPFLVLRGLATRRIHQFESQLPDVLATVAGSLRVGHGLKASLQGIADEGAPPISTELRRVLSEARLGRPLEESLVAMCERLGSDDLIYVATAVDVQSQVGGSLAGVFQTVADTVRQRQQHRSKVRALTATGRASATVLSLFPVALVILITLVNPKYMLPFLESGLGQALMVYCVISIGVGAFVLNRIVNVKG